MPSSVLFHENGRPTAWFADFLRDVGISGETLPGIDSELQRKFFQKGPDGQPLERWELKEMAIPCPQVKFWRHLTLCGFTAQRIPEKWDYLHAVWPGALLSRMCVRLQDLVAAWESGVRWQETVILGGKRPLMDSETAESLLPFVSDGFLAEHDLMSFAHKNIGTEIDAMIWLWEKCVMPGELRDMPFRLTMTPMKPAASPGGKPIRPNTEDTIHEWLQADPQPGSVLISSGMPWGVAQRIAFQTILEPLGFTVETFGHAAPAHITNEAFMREVAGAVNRIRRARGL